MNSLNIEFYCFKGIDNLNLSQIKHFQRNILPEDLLLEVQSPST